MGQAMEPDLLKKRLSLFYQDFIGKTRSPPDPDGDRIHDILVESIMRIPDEKIKKRRPSMFGNGTKVGYSLQLDTDFSGQKGMSHLSDMPFRILVEPGGVGQTLPEQINHSLITIDRVISGMGWGDTARDINYVVRQVFPENPDALSDWWGGIWLGAALLGNRNQFKIYMNLRYGDAAARWQRVANIFRPYADASLEGPFTTLIEKSRRSFGIPVGLALVIADNAVLGFRLYLGLDKPTPDSVVCTMPDNIKDAGCRLKETLENFSNALKSFEDQQITIGYDFSFEDGRLVSRLNRFKADVCLTGFNGADIGLKKWIDRHLDKHHISSVKDFQLLLLEHFGGSDMDYLSFGFKKNGNVQTTLYAKPHGLA